jgi:hypothetical protein
MQRIKLTSTPYSFSDTWVGAILFAVRSPFGGGWDIYFPHPVGTILDADEGAKSIWFHCDNRVKLLPPILRADKPRYTLVESGIEEGVKVWAKVVPINRGNALDCTGCVHDTSSRPFNACLQSPPCYATTRHDSKDIIFITAVEKW